MVVFLAEGLERLPLIGRIILGARPAEITPETFLAQRDGAAHQLYEYGLREKYVTLALFQDMSPWLYFYRNIEED